MPPAAYRACPTSVLTTLVAISGNIINEVSQCFFKFNSADMAIHRTQLRKKGMSEAQVAEFVDSKRLGYFHGKARRIYLAPDGISANMDAFELKYRDTAAGIDPVTQQDVLLPDFWATSFPNIRSAALRGWLSGEFNVLISIAFSYPRAATVGGALAEFVAGS